MFIDSSTSRGVVRRVLSIAARIVAVAMFVSLGAACHRDPLPTVSEPAVPRDALLGPTAYQGLMDASPKDADIWKDARVEVCEYDVSRVEDGKATKGVAIVTTQLIFADPVTKTRATNADTAKNRPALMQRVRLDTGDAVAGKRVTATVFVGVSDAKSLKLEASVLSAESGAFKQYVNHKGTLEWHQFSDLPGTGHTSGTYHPPDNFAFEDALFLVLRRRYANVVGSSPRTVGLLPSQVSTMPSPSTPVDARVECGQAETVDCVLGKIDTRKFTVTVSDAKSAYWFALDAAELGHALVRCEASDGTTWVLRARRWGAEMRGK